MNKCFTSISHIISMLYYVTDADEQYSNLQDIV